MKRVTFIRHAKSSWSSGASRDIDRPLNKRGKRDAPFMARKLMDMGEDPDAFVISPAERILLTMKAFKETFAMPSENILVRNSIYHGSVEDLLDVIHELPDTWDHVFLFCHNPAITYIAHYFGGEHIDNVPTTGVVKVLSETEDWAYFNSNNSKIEAFYYPKMYLK